MTDMKQSQLVIRKEGTVPYGHFVFRNGSKSAEFSCKSSALHQLTRGLDEQTVNKSKALKLWREVRESDLPTTPQGIEATVEELDAILHKTLERSA